MQGARMQYITPDEAKTWTRMLAPPLRKKYRNWNELWNSFVISRWIWISQDEEWMPSQLKFEGIVDNLPKEKDSPAKAIDWNAPLSSVDTLPFAKAVAELKLKNEQGEIAGVDELNEIIKSYLNITDKQ
jgi:hypothetical protein